MKLLDFLQWLGVGGVALLSLYFSQKDKARTNEHGLIEKMKEQLDSSDTRYDKLVERMDKLEEVNMKLREENLTISHERNELLISKQSMERELIQKIENLVKENEELKIRIKDLENQIKYSV